jgi:hypothetical protein
LCRRSDRAQAKRSIPNAIKTADALEKERSMTNVSNDELRRFDEEVRASQRRIGGGRVAMDSTALRKAIRSHREAACRYVEIHCAMAASQPGYLQPAFVVATAYQVEFNDDSLVSMVAERAKSLDAWDDISRIGIARDMESASGEPPEREAARQWWKTSPKEGGICDECRTPLRRGDGYLIDGRIILIGEKKIEAGLELLCQKCFETGKKERTIP